MSLEADMRRMEQFIQDTTPAGRARIKAQQEAAKLDFLIARSRATKLYWQARGVGDYRPCKYCGACPIPCACPISVQCPLCMALPGEKCKAIPGFTEGMLLWHDEYGPVAIHDGRFVVSVHLQRKLGIGRPADQPTPA